VTAFLVLQSTVLGRAKNFGATYSRPYLAEIMVVLGGL